MFSNADGKVTTVGQNVFGRIFNKLESKFPLTQKPGPELNVSKAATTTKRQFYFGLLSDV